MKISVAALSLLVLGAICVVFGFYFFEKYSPLTNSVNNPDVLLWYPYGLILTLGGVGGLVAGLFEIEISNVRRRLGTLDGKAGQLAGTVAELSARVGKLSETGDRLQEKSDKLAEKVDRLSETGHRLQEKADKLTERVGRISDTGNRLQAKSAYLTKKTDELTTKVDRLAKITNAEFKQLSTILKKMNEPSKKRAKPEREQS